MRIYVLNSLGVVFQTASTTGARIIYRIALLVFYEDKMLFWFKTEIMHKCKRPLDWLDV